MRITKIKIRSFGALLDREFDLAPGANVIEGENESGKTSLAAFVKFALYGLDGKKGFPTEKDRYINRQTRVADGAMEFTHEGKAYRIERSVGDSRRETKSLIDLDTLSPVKFSGEIGEYLFGVPESVFVNTAFIRQSAGNAVDSGEIKNAVANILSSADEKISVEKVLKKLDAARTKLKHKNSVGGSLRELDRQITAEEAELAESRTRHSAVIEATGDLAAKREAIEKLVAENERFSLTLQLYDDMRAIERRAKLEGALGEARALKARLDESAAALPAPSLRADAAAARARIAGAETAVADARAELESVGEAKAPRFTASECEADRAGAAKLEGEARSKKSAAIVMLIVGAAALAAGVGLFALKIGPAAAWIAAAIVGAALALIGIVPMGAAAKARKTLGKIYDRWGVGDSAALAEAMERERDAAARESARAREAERAKERLSKAQSVLESARSGAMALYRDAFGGDGTVTGGKDGEEIDGGAAHGADVDGTRCENALDEIERRVTEAEAAHAAIDAEYRVKVGECRAMDDGLRGVDFSAIDERREKHENSDEWKNAAALDEAGLTDAKTRLRFNSEKIRALESRCEELKRTAYTTPGRTPAQIGERLSALRRERDEGELRFEALELAMATVEGCGESIRRDLVPGIVARASEAFAETTAGRHDRLVLDGEDFTLRTSGEDGAYEAELLSAGGADAAYVCLRRALIPALYRREAPPAIYDESFSAIDEKRAERLISLIAAEDGQSLIFTCRASDAERAAARLAPAVNVIRMGAHG